MPQRYAVRFAEEIVAATAGTWVYTVPVDAVLEAMFVHFPPGSEGDLHLTPYILGSGPGGPRTEILARDNALASDAYLSGDEYSRLYDVRLPLPRRCQICVDYANVDALLDHWAEISFEIDHLGGVEAVEGGRIRHG